MLNARPCAIYPPSGMPIAGVAASSRLMASSNGCDVKVVCVIVRRRYSTGPAVPSAVPYEVGRLGNESSKSPRTMYPAVSRRVPEP